MSVLLAACCRPIATERHAEQWVELHVQRLPAVLERYCAKYPVR